VRQAVLVQDFLDGTVDGVLFGPDFEVGRLVLPVVAPISDTFRLHRLAQLRQVFSTVDGAQRARAIHDPIPADAPVIPRLGDRLAYPLVVCKAIPDDLGTNQPIEQLPYGHRMFPFKDFNPRVDESAWSSSIRPVP